MPIKCFSTSSYWRTLIVTWSSFSVAQTAVIEFPFTASVVLHKCGASYTSVHYFVVAFKLGPHDVWYVFVVHHAWMCLKRFVKSDTYSLLWCVNLLPNWQTRCDEWTNDTSTQLRHIFSYIRCSNHDAWCITNTNHASCRPSFTQWQTIYIIMHAKTINKISRWMSSSSTPFARRKCITLWTSQLAGHVNGGSTIVSYTHGYYYTIFLQCYQRSLTNISLFKFCHSTALHSIRNFWELTFWTPLIL